MGGVPQIGHVACDSVCPSGYQMFSASVQLDRNSFTWWESENNWNVIGLSGNVTYYQDDARNYEINTIATSCTCLEENKCYYFGINDFFGDGIVYDVCNSNDNYWLYLNNQLIAANRFYQQSYDRVDFCVEEPTEDLCSLTNVECLNSPCLVEEAGGCQVYQDGNGCVQCKSGYFQQDRNYECVQCQEYFGNECINCNNGPNNGGCSQCATNYDRVYDEECGLYKCKPNPCYYESNHCNVCNNGVCSQCESGYIKLLQDDTECIECKTLGGLGCMHCSDYNGCNQCSDGWLLQESQNGYYHCVYNGAPIANITP